MALANAALATTLIAQTPVALSVAGRTGNDGVSLAASGTFLVATWGASATGGQDIFTAVSRNAGATFSTPVRVNSTPFEARVAAEQPAHVVLVSNGKGRDPGIVIVWTAKRDGAGRLLTARSDDGGATYSTTTVVPGSDAPGNRGWESVTVDPSGKVYVMWLDHRGLVAHTAATAGGPAMPKPDPVEQAGKSALYISSLDGSTPPTSVANSVCYCCKTSLIATSTGDVYGVWRHVYPGDLRDMALTVSRNRGRTFSAPIRVSEDHWEFDGCPDNGPTLAVDAAKRVHVAWPSPADPADRASAMALWYAVSFDGRTFVPRVRIPTDAPAGHVQMLAESNGSVLVAWDEMVGATRTVKLARGIASVEGRVRFTPIPSPGAGKYPSLTMTPSGAVIAWTQPQNGVNVIAVSRIASR
ncbi:MAG: exo-alpha-sialidase [Gemmatimonadaceae bacterium]|nr:exo-alpha-sialidase [Gemmatimonadaceae bacterium]